jgi:hypothetical protein
MNRLILDQARGSFLALYTEGIYLLHNLQQQNQQAMEILSKLSLLEEKLHQANPAVRRRRVQKQIDWLKYRLNETTRQIQAILARSGQITSELQSRQSIVQLEHGRRHMWLSHEQARHLQTLISSGYRGGYQALQLHLQSLMPLNYFVSNGIGDLYTQQQTPVLGPILSLDINPTLNTTLQYSPPSAYFVPFNILTHRLQFTVTQQQPWPAPGETQLQLQTKNPTWSAFTEQRLPMSFHLLSVADIAGLEIYLPIPYPKPQTTQLADPTNHDHASTSSRDGTLTTLASVSILTHADIDDPEVLDMIPSMVCIDETSLPFQNLQRSLALVTSQPVQPPPQGQNPMSIDNDSLMEYRENDGYSYRNAQKCHSLSAVRAANARRNSLPALFRTSVLQALEIEDEVVNTAIPRTGAAIEKGTGNNTRPEDGNHAEWRKTW